MSVDFIEQDLNRFISKEIEFERAIRIKWGCRMKLQIYNI